MIALSIPRGDIRDRVGRRLGDYLGSRAAGWVLGNEALALEDIGDGFDTLDRACAVLLIEEEFRIELLDNEAAEWEKVGDIVEAIARRCGVPAESA